MPRRYTGGFLSAKEQATDANTASGIFTAHEAGALTAAGIFPTGRWTPQRSLRFRRSASAYLTRTPSSASGQDKWTLSTWVKRGSLGDSASQIIGGNTTTSGGTRNQLQVEFGSDNTLGVNAFTNASGYYFQRVSNQLFRDPSAWYHLVVQFDPDNATSDNKVIAYINGQRLSWSTSSDSGAAGNIGSSSYRSINNTFRNDINGGYQGGGVPVYFGDHYLSEMYMISASLVEPSAFAMTDPETGTWIPKQYTGTYGTNGFYLDFRDNSSTTNIALDRSGNGNNWTPNSLSVTPGVTNDSMVDVPGIASISSQNDIGGVQRGNYCTWNPVFFAAAVTYSDANLTAFSSTNSIKNTFGTIAVDTGKWYFEETIAAQSDAYRANLGFVQPLNVPDGFYINDVPGFSAIWNVGNTTVTLATQTKVAASGTGAYESSITVSDTKSVGDVYMFAYDGTSGKIWFGKNGTWFSSGSPSTGANPAGILSTQFSYTPACNLNVTGAGNSVTLNCGQRAFAYTPPTGFKSICTTNLPNPVIKRSTDHFDVKTYIGNGSALTVGNTQKQTQAHPVSNSVLFSSRSAGTSLSRTPTSNGSPVNATFSAWIKPTWPGSLAESQVIFAAGTAIGFQATLYIGTDRALYTYVSDNSIVRNSMGTTQKIPNNTWTHIQWSYNDGTSTGLYDRSRLYINGTRASLQSSPTFPPGNAGFVLNNTSYPNVLGKSSFQAAAYYTGYMAEVNYVDGSALEPSSFGQFDANNNWMPIRYTGTYSTNGFYLPFSDIRNDTTIGYDNSGNSNHFSSPFGLTVLPTATTAPNVLYYGTPGTYTWTAPAGVTSVSYLVVAGGGGGGASYGGGGGAGGMLTGTLSVTPSTSYTVTVGAGGGGGNGLIGGNGSNGSNSVFSSITATGGGAGGHSGSNGSNGGSGGGAGGGTSAGSASPAGQGNNGGASSGNTSGGGGGAGQAGNTRGQAYGGNGLTSAITGVATYYAGGGSGRLVAGGGPGIHGGGLGGGGACTSNNLSFGTPGTGGGGGGTNDSSNGGTGGSGVVILSYTNAGSYIGTGANRSIYQSNVIDAPVDGIDSSNLPHGNYAILDSNNKNSNHTTSNGGLTITSSSYGAAAATIGVSSGKWYYEATISNRTGNNSGGIGWCNELYAVTTQTYLTDTVNSFGINAINGNAAINGGNTAHGSAFSSGDVIMCAIDVDAKKAYFGKNGTWFSSSNPVTGASTFPYAFTGNTFYPAVNCYGDTYQFNFGQQPFTYTPPTGFNALNTKNLKDVGAYNLPDTFGNFVNTPDLVWLKGRSASSNHVVNDTVRGAKQYVMSNSTGGQGTDGSLLGFIPNGFQLGADPGASQNASGTTYVSWNWNRGKTPGFDIVNYGGRGAGTTFEHNLGVEPSFVIIKCISTTGNWITYHKSLTRDKYLYVNSTGGEQSQTNAWIPTSNSFSITQLWGDASTSGLSYIAYLWAEVPGFSKFGTYTGNNATNGPFIYTGFRPRFVMIKRTDTTGNWSITDTAINPFNIALTPALRPNTTETESTVGTVYVQPLSNGFKITNNNTDTNASGTYVYAAYAETPFKYGNAR